MRERSVREIAAYGSSLIIASCGYLGGENGEYDGFVADEVGGEVWLDFGFESLDFILGYVEIAFASCHVAQELDDLVGASVVLEVVSYDILAEVLTWSFPMKLMSLIFIFSPLFTAKLT